VSFEKPSVSSTRAQQTFSKSLPDTVFPSLRTFALYPGVPNIQPSFSEAFWSQRRLGIITFRNGPVGIDDGPANSRNLYENQTGFVCQSGFIRPSKPKVQC